MTLRKWNTRLYIARPVSYLAILCVLSLNSFGSSFNVSPVRIDLPAERPAATVKLDNLSDEPVTIQVRAIRWDKDSDEQAPIVTDDILLNPPIFTLAPRAKQVMRLGLRTSNKKSVEQSYRLILEEVPKAAQATFTGLQTILRISIPIFAKPRQTSAPRLVWKAERAGDGDLRLAAANLGNAHIRITSLEVGVEERDGHDGATEKLSAVYILPGQDRPWVLRNERLSRAARITIRGTSDAGEIHETLVLSAP